MKKSTSPKINKKGNNAKKVVTPKAISKGMQKKITRMNELLALVESGEARAVDYKFLYNIQLTLEDKTASKVYKNLVNSAKDNAVLWASLKGMLGIETKKEIPTFSEWIGNLPLRTDDNPFYSNWDGLNAMAKTRKGILTEKLAKAKKTGKAELVKRG